MWRGSDTLRHLVIAGKQRKQIMLRVNNSSTFWKGARLRREVCDEQWKRGFRRNVVNATSYPQLMLELN